MCIILNIQQKTLSDKNMLHLKKRTHKIIYIYIHTLKQVVKNSDPLLTAQFIIIFIK